MGDGISLGSGRHSSFRRYPSAEVSSIASASSFFEPGVLVIERLQLPRLADVDAAMPDLPGVEAGMLTPGLRQSPATEAPASCFFIVQMACSSVSLLRFLAGPCRRPRACFSLYWLRWTTSAPSHTQYGVYSLKSNLVAGRHLVVLTSIRETISIKNTPETNRDNEGNQQQGDFVSGIRQRNA